MSFKFILYSILGSISSIGLLYVFFPELLALIACGVLIVVGVIFYVLIGLSVIVSVARCVNRIAEILYLGPLIGFESYTKAGQITECLTFLLFGLLFSSMAFPILMYYFDMKNGDADGLLDRSDFERYGK